MPKSVRFQPIVRINEHEISLPKRLPDPLEPSLTLLAAISYRAPDRNHLVCENGLGQDTGIFQCTHMSLTGGDDFVKCVEEIWVEFPPLMGPCEVANVSAILIVVLVRKEPPCHA